MGAFGRAKEQVLKSAVAVVVDLDLPETVENAFAPGPKRLLQTEKSLDAEILDIERVSRAAGYRTDEGQGAAVLEGAIASEQFEPQPTPASPPVERPGGLPPRLKSRRPVLRRRLINVPQETLSLKATSTTVDAFHIWCEDNGFTKKLGFINMVKRIVERSQDRDPLDERRDADLISAADEVIQGQLPRHLARLHNDPEEPCNWYIPTSTVVAFEEWAAERGLTKKKGFEEMVKRVTRSRSDRNPPAGV